MGKQVHCKKCNAGPFGWREHYDIHSGRTRWVLVDAQGTHHECPVREIKEVSCKYCKADDLWWSMEIMEDGTKKNVLMESYGLPHGCEERKKHFDAISQAKKDEYAKEKARIDAIPINSPCSVCANGVMPGIHLNSSPRSWRCWTCGGSGKVSKAMKSKMLYEVRKKIWPYIGKKR